MVYAHRAALLTNIGCVEPCTPAPTHWLSVSVRGDIDAFRLHHPLLLSLEQNVFQMRPRSHSLPASLGERGCHVDRLVLTWWVDPRL